MDEKLEECPKCHFKYRIGDWYDCPHGATNEHLAQMGEPTIVYKNAQGNCWYPTGDFAKPPAGYAKHELRTSRERDQFEREIGSQETAKLRERVYRDREAWHATVSENKKGLEAAKEALLRSGHKPEILERCFRNIEEKEKRFERELKGESGFHIGINHFDSRHKYDE